MENNNSKTQSNLVTVSTTKTNNDNPEKPMEFLAFVDQLVTNTAAETQKLIERTTAEVGKNLQSFAENSVVKSLTNIFGADWLKAILGEVDIDKVEQRLSKLKEKYPDKNTDELAQQIILDKAWEGGKIGLVTNIIPPVAVAMLGIELAATAKLQAEMVYEIAAIHGLDLHEPARRGEVLAIFALSLGSGALKTSMSFVEIIPGVGAVIGASTNAVILYALGYTANQFYQGKYKYFSPTFTTESWQEERVTYWDSALAQSRIMDEILVHMILASYPDKHSWEDILRNLEDVSPSSVKVVATKLENPRPLNELLEELSADFAPLTLKRCYYLARLNKNINSEEEKILNAIANKFNLDWSSRMENI